MAYLRHNIMLKRKKYTVVTFLSASVASWNFKLIEFCSSELSWFMRCFSKTGILDFCCLFWVPSSDGGTAAGLGGRPAVGLSCRAPDPVIPCCCWTPFKDKRRKRKEIIEPNSFRNTPKKARQFFGTNLTGFPKLRECGDWQVDQ